MKSNHAAGGYVALLTVLLTTTLLTVLVFAASTGTFLAQSDAIDYENHVQAQHLALSCIYAAIFSFSKDHAYQLQPEGTVIQIDPQDTTITCKIEEIRKSDTIVSIHASAAFKNTYSLLEATVISTSTDTVPILVSWKEIEKL